LRGWALTGDQVGEDDIREWAVGRQVGSLRSRDHVHV
jgi:hypothetical protein